MLDPFVSNKVFIGHSSSPVGIGQSPTIRLRNWRQSSYVQVERHLRLTIGAAPMGPIASVGQILLAAKEMEHSASEGVIASLVHVSKKSLTAYVWLHDLTFIFYYFRMLHC